MTDKMICSTSERAYILKWEWEGDLPEVKKKKKK